jgi:adenine-specific DNA-methyltransferase
MNNRQKLELTWIGKENRPRLEPRILLEDPERSYHAKNRVTDNDLFDNRLIFGDNLLALRPLSRSLLERSDVFISTLPSTPGRLLSITMTAWSTHCG